LEKQSKTVVRGFAAIEPKNIGCFRLELLEELKDLSLDISLPQVCSSLKIN
jgi:hypothetical protein